MMTSGNSRIVKRKLANNDISYTFSIAKSERVNSRPTHKTLAIVGCFRKSEFTVRAVEFWKIADAKLAELVSTGKLWQNDESKVRKQFEAVIPRPAPAVIKTVKPSTQSNYETMQTVISELKERGISL